MVLPVLLAVLAAAPPAVPEGTRVSLDAERLVRDADGTVRAEGRVRLSAGPLAIAADSLRYDPATGRATAEGGVTVLDGPYAARAGKIQVDLRTRELVLEDAALFEKKEPLPRSAVELRDEAALAAIGTNALDVRARRISRDARGTFHAEEPTVTSCDCGDDPPSWRLSADEATVIPGEKLTLTWPVFRARELPVAAVPWLSLPLERRKTGFLVPELGYSGRRGATVATPFFLVLGESYDLTFTPAYFGGVSGDTAFRGPKETLEVRWAPRRGSEGRAQVSWAYDLSERGELPHRTAYQLENRDDLGAGLADRIQLSLVSDRSYVSDFTDDVTLKTDQALRSTGWLALRRDELLLVVEGTYLQDLRATAQPLPGQVDPGLAGSVRMFGPDARPTFHRLPALALDLRLPLLGGGLDLHLGAARFGPIEGPPRADEGQDGLGPGDAGYVGPDAGEGDGVLGPGEQAAATRIALRPTLSVPLLASRWAVATAFAGWRHQLYLYEAAEDGSQGWGVAGATLGSAVARTFGGVARHSIGPRLELVRLVPGPGEAPPVRPYDELDLGPTRATTQGRAALVQRVDLRDTKLGPSSIRLDLGEDRTLAPAGGEAEAFAHALAQVGLVSSGAVVRVRREDLVVTEVAADAAVGDERGDQLRVGYRRLHQGGSARIRAAPDELLADAPAPAWLPGLDQGSLGATVVIVKGLSVRYDLLHLFTLGELLQQTAGVSYASSCACWSAGASAALRRGQDFPDFFFTADLAGLAR